MRRVASLLLLAPSVMGAFTTVGRHTVVKRGKLSSRRTDLFALSTSEDAKSNLVNIAKRLQQDEGTFVITPQAKSELKRAVSELEAVASPPTQQDYEDFFSGDWTLLCTIPTSDSAAPLLSSLPKLPFLQSGPLKDLKDSLQSRLVVQQRIRSKDRIDHVLQYTPPNTLQDLFGVDDIPEALASLDLNPLQVSQGSVTLIHKAEVQSVTPVLRTRLGLESIVWTVAGTSQVLDPSGADVLGLNLPLGEFLNAGTFDTTYMDEQIRISRGKAGLVDQLRVFMRSPPVVEKEEAGTEEEEWSDDVEQLTAAVVDSIAEETIVEEENSEPPSVDSMAEEEPLVSDKVEVIDDDATDDVVEETATETVAEDEASTLGESESSAGAEAVMDEEPMDEEPAEAEEDTVDEAVSAKEEEAAEVEQEASDSVTTDEEIGEA